MKIIVLFVVFLFGCKHKKEMIDKSPITIKPTVLKKQDTIIHQEVSFVHDGIYSLHTYVTTDSKQRSNTYEQEQYVYFSGTTWCPYSKTVVGNFKYIQQAKKTEKILAEEYFPAVLRRKKEVNDTLEILNSSN